MNTIKYYFAKYCKLITAFLASIAATLNAYNQSPILAGTWTVTSLLWLIMHAIEQEREDNTWEL